MIEEIKKAVLSKNDFEEIVERMNQKVLVTREFMVKGIATIFVEDVVDILKDFTEEDEQKNKKESSGIPPSADTMAGGI